MPCMVQRDLPINHSHPRRARFGQCLPQVHWFFGVSRVGRVLPPYPFRRHICAMSHELEARELETVAMQVDLQASQRAAVTRGSAYVELAAVAWLPTSGWCSNAQGPKQTRVWVGLRWSGRKGPGVTNARAVWAIKTQRRRIGMGDGGRACTASRASAR
ncbi:hypothetical protein F5Y13DRAFT_152179 [Hypoxylon sp. FL1857]|nr:hypothetical protein F5Y13DRAFT_152179 [Hypoxylon sp. FL1857]